MVELLRSNGIEINKTGITSALQHKSDLVRLAAIQWLRINGTRDDVPAIEGHLFDDAPFVRCEAAYTVGSLKDRAQGEKILKEVLTNLKKGLNDTIILQCAQHLARLGNPEGYSRLTDVAFSSKSDFARRLATEAMPEFTNIAYGQVVANLAAIARTDQAVDVVESALRGLASLPEGSEAYNELSKTPSPILKSAFERIHRRTELENARKQSHSSESPPRP